MAEAPRGEGVHSRESPAEPAVRRRVCERSLLSLPGGWPPAPGSVLARRLLVTGQRESIASVCFYLWVINGHVPNMHTFGYIKPNYKKIACVFLDLVSVFLS